MKRQVDQSQFKKWFIVGGISWFLYSFVYPTRLLFNVNYVYTVLFLISLPGVYAAFQVLYILKNRELQTYADIINFLNPKKNAKASFTSELWFMFSLLFVGFLIFFIGTVISTLIFW